jgi:hypothetical protein
MVSLMTIPRIQYGVLFRDNLLYPILPAPNRHYVNMDHVTSETKDEAIDLAFEERTRRPLCVFSVNLQTGEVATVMNRRDLDKYLRHRDRENSPLRLVHSRNHAAKRGDANPGPVS